ncbi:MAG: PRC-barrel domain protein [Chloroflexi bacterium ADurb.Bin180]|nr:MAG: PRC-barrel domain protein [Chloroflexi bacterium ADurb.Bin180]
MASHKRAGFLGDTDDESMPPALGEGCELPLSFSIGAAVHCDDGRCGRLARVVIDPSTDRVTALIVEKGFLQREDRVVPVMAVKSASDDQIVLGMHSSALRDLQEYREVDFRVPVERWDRGKYQPEQTRYAASPYEAVAGSGVVPSRRYRFHEGVPFSLKVVGRGTKVRDADGSLGEVDHVLVDCEGQHITHLIVRQGLFSDYVIVPVDAIVEVDDTGILLTLARDEVRALPRYDRA